MSAVTRRRQKLSAAQNAQWQLAERDRRRVAFMQAQRQQQPGVERLARAGFRVVALPSLNDVLAEMMPPCL